MLSLRASVKFPRDTPSHSGPSVTNVTMLCPPRLLTLAGKKAVIRLSQDSDWAGSTLATALCISRSRAGAQGWPHIAVHSFLHFPNVNELFFFSPLKYGLSLSSHLRARDDILYNATNSRPDVTSESRSMSRGVEGTRKVNLCKFMFFCLGTPLCLVNV